MTPLFKIGQEVQVNDTYSIEYLLGKGYSTRGIVHSRSIHRDDQPQYTVRFTDGSRYSQYGFRQDKLQAVSNTFNSQAEVWEYLLSGGKIKLKTSNFVYGIVDSKVVAVDDNNLEIYTNFYNYQDFTKYTEPAKWYDNIPKSGILCWVGDCQKDLDNKFTAIIKNHNSGNREPFWDIDGETTWTLAIPVTQEEVNKLIYQPE